METVKAKWFSCQVSVVDSVLVFVCVALTMANWVLWRELQFQVQLLPRTPPPPPPPPQNPTLAETWEYLMEYLSVFDQSVREYEIQPLETKLVRGMQTAVQTAMQMQMEVHYVGVVFAMVMVPVTVAMVLMSCCPRTWEAVHWWAWWWTSMVFELGLAAVVLPWAAMTVLAMMVMMLVWMTWHFAALALAPAQVPQQKWFPSQTASSLVTALVVEMDAMTRNHLRTLFPPPMASEKTKLQDHDPDAENPTSASTSTSTCGCCGTP